MSLVIQALVDEVTSTRTVIASAVSLVNGISARIAAAVAAAIGNGATAEELQPLADLGVAMKADADALAAAVAANQ